MADKQNYDVIFIEGGLAAGLAAALLQSRRPDLTFIILEARTKPEMPQTWSFQSLPEDIDPSAGKVFSQLEKSWLHKYISKSWAGYDVRFPDLEKGLEISYHSIRSADFWAQLRRDLGPALRTGETVIDVTGSKVTTAKGQVFTGTQLLDTRGWAKDAFAVAGYQKFIGLNLTTAEPHGLKRPILMDATVPQVDGFRFIYTLPWSATELLIEDTCYSNTADIDVETYTHEILNYAAAQGWTIKAIGEQEEGALALPSFSRTGFLAPSLGRDIPQLGVRGGLFHPTTGYSIYDAVLGAENLVQSCQNTFANVSSDLKKFSKRRWHAQEFYRRLNNMLFFASEPSNRYQILERFYEHDDALIARFYAGATTTTDKLRIMSGRPPIPMRRAIYHFFNRSEVQHG